MWEEICCSSEIFGRRFIDLEQTDFQVSKKNHLGSPHCCGIEYQVLGKKFDDNFLNNAFCLKIVKVTLFTLNMKLKYDLRHF